MKRLIFITCILASLTLEAAPKEFKSLMREAEKVCERAEGVLAFSQESVSCDFGEGDVRRNVWSMGLSR